MTQTKIMLMSTRYGKTNKTIEEIVKRAIKAERERCEKIALSWRRNGPFLAADGSKPSEIDEAYNLAIDEVLKAIREQK